MGKKINTESIIYMVMVLPGGQDKAPCGDI